MSFDTSFKVLWIATIWDNTAYGCDNDNSDTSSTVRWSCRFVSKFPMHICSQKFDKSLCQNYTFLIAGYDHGIID